MFLVKGVVPISISSRRDMHPGFEPCSSKPSWKVNINARSFTLSIRSSNLGKDFWKHDNSNGLSMRWYARTSTFPVLIFNFRRAHSQMSYLSICWNCKGYTMETCKHEKDRQDENRRNCYMKCPSTFVHDRSLPESTLYAKLNIFCLHDPLIWICSSNGCLLIWIILLHSTFGHPLPMVTTSTKPKLNSGPWQKPTRRPV